MLQGLPGIKEIQETIAKIDPLPGAKEFLDELRSFSQVILISDTFTEFAQPLMEKLGRPTLFCNSLEIAENGEIILGELASVSETERFHST